MRVTEFIKNAQLYLFWRGEAENAVGRKNAARDFLKDYIGENGEPDENGTRRIYFEQAINGKYAGLELRKVQPQDRINTDAAKDFVKERGLENEVVSMVPIYDWDQLLVLNQQGKISDAELDALFITPDPTYSLYTIEE